MRRIMFAAIAVFMLFSMVACSDQITPEPERCSLCDSFPCHAPCLVNLHTGEVGEIALYEPHPTLVAEIAEVQRGGYFRFQSAAGLRGYMDASVPEAHIPVPGEVEAYEEQYFCFTCRDLLEEYSDLGYVLSDLRKPAEPTLYPVTAGTEFEVRCYTVTVTENDDKELDIMVTGSIPTDE